VFAGELNKHLLVCYNNKDNVLRTLAKRRQENSDRMDGKLYTLLPNFNSRNTSEFTL
jgi:hypothetical protein